jgi:hypothetical protein
MIYSREIERWVSESPNLDKPEPNFHRKGAEIAKKKETSALSAPLR